MTQTTLVTDQEVKDARDLQFPPDLNWEAKYSIREQQMPGDGGHQNIRWAQALDHELMGLENLIRGNAEKYIVNDLAGGLHVALSFTMTLWNGHVTALAKMQRAMRFHGYGYNPTHEDVLAQAAIRVNFKSERTHTLVKAALSHRYLPD